MKFNKHQCRACGKDHSKQSKDWRRKNNCRPWPTPDPAHLPKKSWKAPNAGMICGDCRQIKHKVTRVATSLQKKSSKQTAKLREQSKKLSKTKVTLKVVREQVKKLEHVSARKPETTSDFAAFCKEKRVSATELRVFRKVRLWLSKRRKAGASVKDVVEPLLDILNNGRLPCDHIFYEYIRRCAVNLNRKHIAAARWVERIKVMWPRERLIERSLSTDDLETFFGSVVVHCQYKPRLVPLSGGMRNIEYRTKLRRTAREQLGFSISSSRSSKYAQSVHSAKQMQPMHA